MVKPLLYHSSLMGHMSCFWKRRSLIRENRGERNLQVLLLISAASSCFFLASSGLGEQAHKCLHQWVKTIGKRQNRSRCQSLIFNLIMVSVLLWWAKYIEVKRSNFPNIKLLVHAWLLGTECVESTTLWHRHQQSCILTTIVYSSLLSKGVTLIKRTWWMVQQHDWC